MSVRLRTKWLSVQVPLQSLKLQISACFEQGVPSHSGNYRVWIHSETRTWHDKNIQSILTDLQKSFDAIDHEVLLQKHKAVRFSEQSIQ